MDILLVFPFSRTHYSVPPLGLGYLATALRGQNYDVQILDCTRDNLDLDGFRQRVRQLKPRMVGFQTFSYDFHTVEQCLGAVKESTVPS